MSEPKPVEKIEYFLIRRAKSQGVVHWSQLKPGDVIIRQEKEGKDKMTN